jgi:hypothetical protein
MAGLTRCPTYDEKRGASPNLTTQNYTEFSQIKWIPGLVSPGLTTAEA